MQEEKVFIQLRQSNNVYRQDVFLKDLGDIFCQNTVLLAKLRSIKVYHFQLHENEPKVFQALELMECIHGNLKEALEITFLGQVDTIVLMQQKRSKKNKEGLKTAVVSLICFFGTGFTIMAYHNDIGITGLFDQIYEMLMGTKAPQVHALEIAYSLGLGVGIILFFNHFGKWRITQDLPPVEVSMTLYEQDLNTAIIQARERQERQLNRED